MVDQGERGCGAYFEEGDGACVVAFADKVIELGLSLSAGSLLSPSLSSISMLGRFRRLCSRQQHNACAQRESIVMIARLDWREENMAGSVSNRATSNEQRGGEERERRRRKVEYKREGGGG